MNYTKILQGNLGWFFVFCDKQIYMYIFFYSVHIHISRYIDIYTYIYIYFYIYMWITGPISTRRNKKRGGLAGLLSGWNVETATEDTRWLLSTYIPFRKTGHLCKHMFLYGRKIMDTACRHRTAELLPANSSNSILPLLNFQTHALGPLLPVAWWEVTATVWWSSGSCFWAWQLAGGNSWQHGGKREVSYKLARVCFRMWPGADENRGGPIFLDFGDPPKKLVSNREELVFADNVSCQFVKFPLPPENSWPDNCTTAPQPCWEPSWGGCWGRRSGTSPICLIFIFIVCIYLYLFYR